MKLVTKSLFVFGTQVTGLIDAELPRHIYNGCEHIKSFATTDICHGIL